MNDNIAIPQTMWNTKMDIQQHYFQVWIPKICVFILKSWLLSSAQLRLNARENSRTPRPCEHMNSCTARHNCFLMHSWLPFSTCPGRKGHYLQKINSSHLPLKQAAFMPGSTALQHNNELIHYFLKQVAFSFTMQNCP